MNTSDARGDESGVEPGPAIPAGEMPHAVIRASSRSEQVLQRAALAVSRGGGPKVYEALIAELADILEVDVAFVAVFDDVGRNRMRSLAAWLDGRLLRNFSYTLAGTPCADVVGRDFRYVEKGVSEQFLPDTIFAAKRMDCYAAYPLFAAAGRFLTELTATADVRVVILRMSAVVVLDASGARALREIVAELTDRGIAVLVKGASPEHRRLLEARVSITSEA